MFVIFQPLTERDGKLAGRGFHLTWEEWVGNSQEAGIGSSVNWINFTSQGVIPLLYCTPKISDSVHSSVAGTLEHTGLKALLDG